MFRFTPMNNPNWLDALILEVDKALRTLIPPENRVAARPSPAKQVADCKLSVSEKKHIAGLMRVNHAGEVCAQALYQGQALTAQMKSIQDQMQQAAAEETDHLAWCEHRLQELDSKPSVLNLFWYSGSFLIGACAGLAGDAISLGFVAETERQVSQHLQNHLNVLPLKDKKTIAIVEGMLMDEDHHAGMAVKAGAIELPYVIRRLMAGVSKLMTCSSYYV